MKNLARHIELLLRDNDCVILPGFGGFVAHDAPAYYVSEEGLYYPPSRSISFNATITMNDGLLTQSYMKSYQVDYARATYMVDMAIEELTDILDEEGIATLPHIGVLRQDISQSLQFTPNEVSITSPQHFGLGSFIIRELSQLQTTESSLETAPIITQTTKTISLHIRKDVLHRITSTAAIFLLLLMIALPTGNHQPSDAASLQLTEIITTPQVQSVIVSNKPVITAGDTKNKDTALADTTETTHTINQETTSFIVEYPIVGCSSLHPTSSTEVFTDEEVLIGTTIDEKTYHIIVASLPSHRGIDETMSQYTRLGYNNISLVERDDRVRISLMQFTDKTEANRQLNILRQQERFQNAWLLAVRN